MIRFEDQIKRCSELLYQLCDDVQRLNNLNYFDMNITCEYFYIHLLNCIFGWNLRNENFTQKNASTIDLVDNDNRIAIQVTSNKSANKIHNTLKSFRETKLYEKYDRLIFIVIVKKKSYSANFGTDIQGAFLFDEKRDIYTMDKLIRKIQDLGYQKVAEICEYLEFELGIVKDPKRVWTVSAAFQDISDSTNGFLNEDFFEIDDYRFKDRFKIELERKPIEIHINGSDKEETMYCILNHIHTLIPDKQIFIIRDEQSWIAAKNRIVDSIVIPFFAATQIPVLQGNINIFIHGAQKHHKNGLELRRRTRSFLNLKLQKNQYPDAHILIKKTSGIYYFLKKELYQGDIESPAWGQDKHIAVISSIMVGSWCQSNNDWQVLETVAQKPYSELIEYLEKYINGEMPLILKKCHNNQVSYELADPEISWCEIKDNITDDLINRFLSAIKMVLSGCKNHSGLLIKGMLRTMIFLAIHNYKQSAIDRCVEEILSGIKTTNGWNCIANHMVALCEASPKAIISRLQDGLHDNSGLLNLFAEDVSAISWEGSNYIQILWAVEMLLGHKQYAICAIRWLMELSNYVEKCSSGNNPRDTISKVFCIYYNNVAISVPDKIYLAEEGLKKYYYLWDILFEQLPFITSFSIMPTQEFSYREDDGIGVKELSWSEINQQRLAFYNLLFNKIGSDIEKWLKILQLFPHITDQMLNDAIETLMTDLKAMHDSDRERIGYAKSATNVLKSADVEKTAKLFNEKVAKKIKPVEKVADTGLSVTSGILGAFAEQESVNLNNAQVDNCIKAVNEYSDKIVAMQNMGIRFDTAVVVHDHVKYGEHSSWEISVDKGADKEISVTESNFVFDRDLLIKQYKTIVYGRSRTLEECCADPKFVEEVDELCRDVEEYMSTGQIKDGSRLQAYKAEWNK